MNMVYRPERRQSPHIPAFIEQTSFYPEKEAKDIDPALLTDDWSFSCRSSTTEKHPDDLFRPGSF